MHHDHGGHHNALGPDGRPFPLAPLLGAGALVAFTLAVVGMARVTGLETVQPPPSTVAIAHELRFADRTDGGIAVFATREARPGAALPPVDVVEPGTNGFLRATMRGLARERKRQGVGPEPPFRLTAWADGRLTLEDPSTGRRVDLEAFGQTNAGVFARLLAKAEAAP